MRFYLRNFLIVLSIAFGTIFFWIVFLSNSPILLVHKNHLNLNNVPLSKQNSKIQQLKFENFTSNDLFVTGIKPNNISSNVEKYSYHTKKIRNIVCKINGEYKINCLKLITGKDTSIYIPFSFIHKYFEIHGKIVNPKSTDEYFEWNHSYSKIFYPDEPYDNGGKFLWFGNYNVEFRDRVKCISAIENVPISTQWYPDGHLYPTQISQYGLSHFNKNISSPNSSSIKLIDYGIVSNYLNYNYVFNSKKNYVIVKDEKIYLKNNYTDYLISQIEILIEGNASISFMIVNTINHQVLRIIYSTTDEPIDLNIKNQAVAYGIGSKVFQNGWFKLTRDLLVDLLKGNLITDRKRNNYYLSHIQIDGVVNIKNFVLKTLAHGEFALAAGDWLVRNQNHQGGWEIKVKRKLAKGALIIREGWHSAMGQGHAISLLTRLFRATSNQKYLDSAKKALNIFEIESFKHGVKAILFDKYNWYEEYPTVPSIFVLNGFIYSLFGLYDLSKTCQDNICKKSGQLFDEGIRSLEAALPLFDSGSGSFYDLRHLSLGIAPNIARWDYHSTHINQLLFLYTIARNDLFQTIAERWISYMKGHRASHN